MEEALSNFESSARMPSHDVARRSDASPSNRSDVIGPSALWSLSSDRHVSLTHLAHGVAQLVKGMLVLNRIWLIASADAMCHSPWPITYARICPRCL